MKKVILSAAILLGSMTAFATPTVATIQTNTIVNIQDEFTEITLDVLPEAVKTTIANSFDNAKIDKAYTNENKEYKLDITIGEKSYTIYTDAEGTIITK